MSSKRINYATLSVTEKCDILLAFTAAKQIGATDPGHAAAIAACNAFHLTDQQWNRTQLGAQAFAAALAVAYMHGYIKLEFAPASEWRNPVEHRDYPRTKVSRKGR